MACETRDLLDDFARYWRTASGLDPVEREAAWLDLYESRHPDVFDHYFDAWGSREELLASALGQHDGDVLLRRAARLRAVLEPSVSRTREVLGVHDVQLRFVLMVGLFRADGWTHRLEGQDMVFFCVERLPDPSAYPALVAHETAHVLHLAVRRDRWPEEALGLNLLVEGLAVTTARDVDPHLGWAGLFSVDDWNGWRRACLSAWPHAVAELLHRFDEVDRDQYQRFFWPDWIRTHNDVPERIGYFIGYRVARALARRHGSSEIVRWPAHRARTEVRKVLEAWPRGPDGGSS